MDSKILIGDAPLDAEPIAPASVTTLPQLFHHTAETQPDNIAYSVQTEHGLHTITYAEVDAKQRRWQDASQLPLDMAKMIACQQWPFG